MDYVHLTSVYVYVCMYECQIFCVYGPFVCVCACGAGEREKAIWCSTHCSQSVEFAPYDIPPPQPDGSEIREKYFFTGVLPYLCPWSWKRLELNSPQVL